MTKLPNLLTLVRIFLVPLLVAALVQQDFRIFWGDRVLIANDFFGLIVFLAAALDRFIGRLFSPPLEASHYSRHAA